MACACVVGSGRAACKPAEHSTAGHVREPAMCYACSRDCTAKHSTCSGGRATAAGVAVAPAAESLPGLMRHVPARTSTRSPNLKPHFAAAHFWPMLLAPSCCFLVSTLFLAHSWCPPPAPCCWPRRTVVPVGAPILPSPHDLAIMPSPHDPMTPSPHDHHAITP